MEKRRKTDPRTFIGIGVCFMGAGIALSAALRGSGSVGVGPGLLGLGVICTLTGVAQKRKLESSQEPNHEDDPPA